MSYTDLINIDEFTKRETFSEERWDVSFYCKDCKKIVETTRQNPKSYVFICKECEGKNIALWTLEWLKANYKIK
jgi:Zn finger protein HypA/HybF involved in hydrogenase expression